MEKRIIDIAIAGLLHDIGKLVQRSRDEPWKAPEGYEREGQPVHALWSAYFIEHTVPKEFKGPALQAEYHHQPEKSPAADHSLSTLIAVADKLSAGERADETQESQGSNFPQQMVSIFDRVGAYRLDPSLAHHYLPLSRLSLDHAVLFPQPVMASKERITAYEKLLHTLEDLVKENIDDPETYLEQVTAALEQTTWCVPSAFYHNLPDVSLYDHSRMTAALAVCLAESDQAQLEQLLAALRADFSQAANPEQKSLLDRPAALLIGGDISGIQKFIYTISSKHAAKTLRGRSLYLQLLTEAMLRYVLRELGIPRVNVIYSGGGHFYLLAPLSAAEKIPDIQKRITRMLLRHHGASLYLALASVEVPASGFRLGQFPAYWDALHTNLAQAKQQRYSELGDGLYQEVFQPESHGGNREQMCSVCGEESEHTQLLDEEERICPLCASFDDPLGKHLTRASFIALDLGAPAEIPVNTALDVLAEFGMGIRLLDADGKALGENERRVQPERVVLWALQDPQKWPEMASLPAAKTIHYMVNHVPEATFDELQKGRQGIHRLGVLRMDVDNLGSIFKDGFGIGDQSIATIARLSTLSLQVSLYFDGWVKKICEQVSKNIYAVYSGGDDLFLIAPWDIVPALAARIAAEFSTYTAGNPDLHISGGMAFIHGKYPVYQAADDAADTLDLAKNHAGKNAFHFMGCTWSWPEFEALTRKFEVLVEAVDHHDAPASLLQLLQNLAQMDAGQRKQRGGRRVWGKWLWLGEYQFTRMKERGKENKLLLEDLNSIQNDLKPYYETIGQWGKAARWAQIYTRKSGDREGVQA